MLEKGIRVGGGTDGTRVSSFNPWIGIYQFVSGKSLGGLKFASSENQVDRISALKIYTLGSASLIHQDNERGMLKKNFLADLAILNSDYLGIKEDEIKDIHSILTILNGKVVYGAQEYQKLAPKIPSAIPSWSPINFYGGYQSH